MADILTESANRGEYIEEKKEKQKKAHPESARASISSYLKNEDDKDVEDVMS